MTNIYGLFAIGWTILFAWKKTQIFDMQFELEFEADFGQVAFWHDDHDDMTFIRGILLWCDAGDVTNLLHYKKSRPEI